jgi:pyruvate dehydrogenase E2 component (dihydrolipoamide acetyltransferase)
VTEIAMPQLSDSMEQGLVLQWLIEDGAEVQVGDELLEIETDKATMTYISEVAGTLSIIVAEGTTVAVGEPIARVGGAEPRAPVEVAADGAERSAAANGGSVGEPAAATPVARRLAAVHGITLSTVRGTGPRGRITKADVLDAGGLEAPPAPAPAPRGSDRGGGNGGGAGAGKRTEQLSRLQQVVARRMAEAKSTIPHFQVQTEARMDAALALRAELKALAAERENVTVPSVNDLIVKASALALREHPHANGSYRDGGFELHDRVNVGVAVAAEGALVVPTVFDADTKSVGEIAREVRRLAERVRTSTITPPELSGATFTVSNLGMYGMTAITPVINPPQAAILGVGAARETLAREAGEIVERSLLTLTLSCDHRILYGADAARFLADVKALLEAPLCLGFT